MSTRNYSNFAKTATIADGSGGVGSGDTSIDVDTQTDYPDAPYVIVVFEGGDTPPAAPKKEVMRVTAVSGSGPYTLTVERDIDGYNGAGQSFTTSATVQHVSIADEVGPQRSVVQSQTLKASQRLVVYDDFDRETLGSAPTGQSWNVRQGDPVINDGSLTRSQVNPDVDTTVTIPYDISSNQKSVIEATGHNSDGSTVYIFVAWQDPDNWIAVGLEAGKTNLTVNNSGTVNKVDNTDYIGGIRNGKFEIGAVITADANTGEANMLYYSKEVNASSHILSSDEKSIINNSNNIGVGIVGYFTKGVDLVENLRVYDPHKNTN